MLKWSPKAVEYNVNYSSLKETPFWSCGSNDQANNLKEVMGRKKTKNKVTQKAPPLPGDMRQQMLISNGINHKSEATKLSYFPLPSHKKLLAISFFGNIGDNVYFRYGEGFICILV